MMYSRACRTRRYLQYRVLAWLRRPEEPEAMRTSPLSILFTGHMVDLPDRTAPRFPPALVAAARDEIANHVMHHVGTRNVEMIKGFASLARGGDILFHEVCRSFGIDTVIV